MRKMAFIPFCRFRGCVDDCHHEIVAENSSRERTRKLPSPQRIAEALFNPSAPWPPANRITDAKLGLAGLIRMNACLTPRGVPIATSVEFCAAAGGVAAESKTHKAILCRRLPISDVSCD